MAVENESTESTRTLLIWEELLQPDGHENAPNSTRKVPLLKPHFKSPVKWPAPRTNHIEAGEEYMSTGLQVHVPVTCKLIMMYTQSLCSL